MIYYRSPFRSDKNLGKAYNDEMQMLPGDAWVCFTDFDACFLHYNFNNRIEQHIKLRPDTGLFTCYTNRVKNWDQCIHGEIGSNPDIIHWKKVACDLTKYNGEVVDIGKEVSGVCMVFSKKTWLEAGGFRETGKPLGIDHYFCWEILKLKKKILLMKDVFIFHYYRLVEGIKFTKHLKLLEIK